MAQHKNRVSPKEVHSFHMYSCEDSISIYSFCVAPDALLRRRATNFSTPRVIYTNPVFSSITASQHVVLALQVSIRP